MAPELERITAEMLSLPASSRAALAKRLLESLDEADVAEIEASWLSEAERRCREIDEGKVELLSGAAVLRELRAKVA